MAYTATVRVNKGLLKKPFSRDNATGAVSMDKEAWRLWNNILEIQADGNLKIEIDPENANKRIIYVEPDSQSLNDIKQWENGGASVRGLEVYFEVDPTANVPSSFPGSDTNDDPPVPHTWATWGANDHAPRQMAADHPTHPSKWFRSNIRNSNAGPLNANKWVDYITTPADGVNEVFTKADFITINDANPV